MPYGAVFETGAAARLRRCVALLKRKLQNTRVKQFVNRRKLPIKGYSLRASETLRAQRYHFRRLFSGHHVGDAIRYSRRRRDKRGIRPADVMPARNTTSRMSEDLSDCCL